MRLIQNERHINIRRKAGEIAPFAGLIVLGISTYLVFTQPELIWLSMALVWAGLIISLIGSYLGSRYVGVAAHYKKVPEGLKGLDDQYALLVYKSPVPFLLMDPGGLTVLTVKSHDGSIRYEDGKWHLDQKMGFMRRFAGQEGLGKPEQLLEAEIGIVERWIGKALPEGVEVPVRGVVVISNPEAQLELESEPPVLVLRLKSLKRWLRKDGKRSRMPEETRATLVETLGLED